MTVGDFWRLEVLPTLARTWTPELQWPGSRWTRHGDAWRGCCPLHGGDNSTGFEVTRQKGGWLWRCWTRCGSGDLLALLAGGTSPRGAEFVRVVRAAADLAGVDTAPIDSAERQDRRPARQKAQEAPRLALRRPTAQEPTSSPRTDLEALLARYQAALRVPGNLGARYLEEHRGIPLEVALQWGAGYAEPGTWPGRPWKWGRLVFPHRDHAGALVNIYGRAVGADDRVPKALRHDHLRGPKGLLLPPGGLAGPGPLLLVEGAVDALAAAAAGWGQTVGCFGLSGWDWPAARSAGVREVVLALDQDQPGQEAAQDLARSGALHGMTVGLLDPSAWGGQKDLAAAWLAGALDLQSLELEVGPERSVLDTVAERQAIEEPPALAQPLDNIERITERITTDDDDGNPWAGIWDRVFGTAQEEAIWLRRLCTR
jgi:hypothetical protein